MFRFKKKFRKKNYALLQAILSSANHRLTLSQIYDYLLSILPYPNARVDNSSYAGWKNSVRHNLSLHERFSKIPHERAGKPCWWTVNQDKPCGKKQKIRKFSESSNQRLQESYPNQLTINTNFSNSDIPTTQKKTIPFFTYRKTCQFL